jgi:hypothetical protein
MQPTDTPEVTVIKWSDDKGALPVVQEIAKNVPFTIELENKEQVDKWSELLKFPEAESSSEITIEILQAALPIIAILTLAGVLAYAIGRFKKIHVKKTKTTLEFTAKNH